MRHLSFKLSAALLMAGVIGGCHCYHPPPSSTLTVSFTAPTNGQVLTAANNTEPSQPGFHFNVAATATDSSGATVNLAGASLLVNPPGGSGTTTTLMPDGGSSVTFENAALLADQNVLTVSVVDSQNRQATAQIIVTVGAQTPTVSIVSPAAGASLNASNSASQDGGPFTLGFSIASSGLNGASGVLSCPNDCGIPPTAFTLNSNGTATVDITLTEPACMQTSVTCEAQVTSGGQTVTSPSVTFSLDSQPPEVAIYSPVDGTSSSQTFNVVAVVSCAEDGSTATLARTGATTLSTTVQGGVVTFSNVNVPADGSYDFTLSVSDKGGNTTQTDLPVVVESAAPTIQILVPAASPTWVISMDEDTNPANGIQTEVDVQVDSEPVGTPVQLWTTVSGTLAQPFLQTTVQSGVHHWAKFMDVALAEGANTLRASVTDIAGLGSTTVQVVTVTTGRPDCRIMGPADNLYLNDAGNPLQVNVEAAAGNVNLEVVNAAGISVDAGTQTSSGSGQVGFTAVLPAGGDYNLVATCGATGVSQFLPVHYETAIPTLTAQVEGDTSGTGDLGPNVIDTSPLPGMQVIVDVTTAPYSAVTAVTDAATCGLTSSSSGTTNATGLVKLRDLTVPQAGPCNVTVTGVDRYGNASTKVMHLTSNFSGGTIAISNPMPGSTIGGPDAGTGNGTSVPITVTFGAPTGGGTVTISVNAQQVATSPVTSSQTSFTTPTPVALQEGANVVRATLTDASGQSTCVVGIIYVNTKGAGTITLTEPTVTNLNLAADEDPNTPGIQNQLAYTDQPVSNNASVSICVSQLVGNASGVCPGPNNGSFFLLASNAQPNMSDFPFPDGTYALMAVLDDNGVFSNSQQLQLQVDSVRPNVTSVSIPAASNGTLNSASFDGGPLQMVVKVTNLNGGTVNVYDQASNQLYGSATDNGTGTINVSLGGWSLVQTPDRNYTFIVVLTRPSGNTNNTTQGTPLDPLNTAAIVTLNDDTDNPTIAITAPTKTVLGIADLDAGSGALQLQVAASISDIATDVSSSNITITGSSGSTPVGILQVNGTNASQVFSLSPSSSPENFTFTVTATDSAGNVGSQQLTVTAVTQAPTCTFTAPTSAGNPYTSHSIPTSVNTSGYQLTGQNVAITDTNGGAPTLLGNLVVAAGGTASGTLTYPNGTGETVGCSLTDAAGNTGAGSATGINVVAPGCTVEFTAPASNPENFGIAQDANTGAAGLQYVVMGTTPDCHGLGVKLCSGTPCTVGNQLATATADVVTGAFSFPTITLADNSAGTLTLEMNNGFLSDTTISYTVKLTPPVMSGVQINGLPNQTTAYFVAPTNINVESTTPNPSYFVDQASGPPYNSYATANFGFTVTNANGGKASLTYNGTQLGGSPVNITSNSQAVSFTSGTVLTQKSGGTLQFTVVDTNGNSAMVTDNVVKVDVIPPAPFSWDAGIANQRDANIGVAWTLTGDDGTTGSASGYDIRWSTAVVAPSGITTDSNYFNLGTQPTVVAAPLQGASTTSYTLTGLPPLNTYWIAARAVDGVGNYSPMQTTSPQTVNRLDNFWTQVTFNGSAAGGGSQNGFYGFELYANGDMDGDGFDDLVVTSLSAGSATDQPGAVYVYYGATNFGSTVPVTLSPPAATQQNGESYGNDVGIGEAGKIAAETRPDLLVGAPLWSSNRGRAFLYFGQPNVRFGASNPDGGSGTLDVEFRDAPAATAQFGTYVNIIPDINGDGLDEVLIAAPGTGATGVVYLFYGRSVAAWQALATHQDTGDPTFYIAATQADRIFQGPASASQQFGAIKGYAGLGDLNGAPNTADFAIPAEYGAQVYIYDGADVDSAAAGATLTVAGNTIQTLSEDTGGGGFGVSAVSDPGLVGNASKMDLAVSSVAAGRIYLFADATSTGFANTGGYPLVIQGNGANDFGYFIAKGDLNTDTFMDLAAGENPSSGSGSTWVFYHHPSGTEFDTSAGAGFQQSRLQNTGTPNSLLGIGLAIGDFNGDGKKDLAAGDPVGNVVFAWY